MRHIVIVTGSRKPLTERGMEIVSLATSRALGFYEPGASPWDYELYVGDATGVDAYATRIARRFLPKENVRVFEAYWTERGKRAGPERNERMVLAARLEAERHDDVQATALAFPDRSSVGTWDCVRRMVAHGFEVRVVGVDEAVTVETEVGT